MAYTQQQYSLLAAATAIDMNTTGDTTITINNANSYIVIGSGAVAVYLINGSTTTTNLVASIWTGAGGTGTKLYEWATPVNFNGTTIAQSSAGTATLRTEQTLYFRVTTANGAALTGDLIIYGLIVT